MQTRVAGNVPVVARPWPFSEGAIDEPVLPPKPSQASRPAVGPHRPRRVCAVIVH